MNTTTILLSTITACLLSAPAFADQHQNTEMDETVKQATQELQNDIQESKTEMEETTEEMKHQMEQFKKDAASESATKQEQVQETKEEIKQALTESPANAELRIISPSDGDEISSPVTVIFGLKGMGVAPAGVDKENTGHHHLIIDGGDELPTEGMPMGDNVKHFGGGQTQADVELEKGTHTLQLILGDMNHIPHNPPVVSEKITITVK